MFAAAIARAVGFCVRHAVGVVVAGAVLATACGSFAVTHFALNSDTNALLSPDLPWRQREDQFAKTFPDRKNLILVVVDGATPERAQQATVALTAALAKQRDLFYSVRQPGGGPFFEQNGLLFLPPQETASAVQDIIAAQPFLGALASDPSLRGVMVAFSTALRGVTHGDVSLERMDRPITEFERTLQDFFAGRPAFLSWRKLMLGGEPSLHETRRLIEVEAVLDYGELTPAGKPSRFIRDAAKQRGLMPENGVRIRLTGPVPIADEEFATLAERAGLIATVMGGAILIMLWFALRSPRLIVGVLITILAGLSITAALGLLFLGAFNIISIAFIALFVGLGIDFGIQFCVRYRAERHALKDLDQALIAAGRDLGPSLTLAMLAITAGFLAFLPTSYSGVAELGLVAGIGMPLVYVLSLTLLPALIKLMRPGGEAQEAGFPALASANRFVLTHARSIAMGAGAGGVVALALLPWLEFDFNPLNLRSHDVESMSTLLDLSQDPDTSPNTLDIIAADRDAAAALARKLSALPTVAQVITIDDFIPKDQPQKLAEIADASMLLDLTLSPLAVKPAPTDAELVASLRATATRLKEAAGTANTAPASKARALAASLERLIAADAATRDRAAAVLTNGLDTLLDQVRGLLKASPITLQSVPPDIARDWLAPSGAARIKVFPKGDPTDNAALRAFTAAVLAVAPQAVGPPLSIAESGRTISDAFIQAGALSFVAIAIILVVALRNGRDVALSLGPLLLAGALTLGTCVAVGLKLNYANIIALPLLFGIGVAFDIYFVMAWRSGTRALLQSPLARAVTFSAGTTAAGFGALWLSSHPGTASMGELLMISLAWILAIVLVVLPALLQLTDRAAVVR